MFKGFTISLLLSLTVMGTTSPEGFISGSAKVVIPTRGKRLYLAGLKNDRISEGTHDDIYAKSLVLSDGNTKICIVALDIIGLSMYHTLRLRELIKDIGTIDPENVILTCTHQHSGPDTIGLWGPTQFESGVDKDFLKILYEKIVESTKKAESNLEPAIFKVGSIAIPEGVSKNSREPEMIDRNLSVIRIESTSNRSIATLLNFSAHPEVLWSDNHLITADYPCYVYQVLEEKIGGEVLFVNGALGGMVTTDNAEHTFEEAERIGKTIANKALEALESAEMVSAPRITIRKAKVEIPLENQYFITLMDAGVLPKEPFNKGNVVTEVNYIKIGEDIEIATFPGEALPKLGFMVKDRMKAKYKFIFGLANDELGYILHEDDFDRELYDYERSMSVGRKAGTVILNAIMDLMRQK